MSDLSLPPSGYSTRRSPSALAAAIAINGGVFALLIALPATQVIRFVDPPLPTHEVRLAPIPPDVEKEKPKPEPSRTQKTIPTPRQPDKMRFVEPIIPTDGGLTLDGGPPIGDFGKTQIVSPPQMPSIFVKARPHPRYADAFRPDYPPALRREGIEGSVTVRVAIDEHGRVTGVELVTTTDPRFFEETRQQALRYWRFEPARRDGVAIASEQTMTVHFRLEDK